MEEAERAAIAVVGAKGEIIIPQELRRQLAIKPKTRLAVYRRDDKLIVVKINLPTAGEDLEGVLRKKGQRSGRASQRA
jgi:AbrB family looped-hinge helix DNA binding protein